jgi:hypothetical protein
VQCVFTVEPGVDLVNAAFTKADQIHVRKGLSVVNSLSMLLAATAMALTACSAREAEPATKSPTSAEIHRGEKITPSPWQPPAEVDPAHKHPGDRVDPGKPPPRAAPTPSF